MLGVYVGIARGTDGDADGPVVGAAPRERRLWQRNFLKRDSRGETVFAGWFLTKELPALAREPDVPDGSAIQRFPW